MEKTIEHEMETGIIQGYIRVVRFGVWIVGIRSIWGYMGYTGYMGFYRDSGEETGNYYNGVM